MISHLELRQIIESGFTPMKCICTITHDNLMTFSLFEPHKGHPALEVRNLNAAELTTSRAIASLVLELKDELAHQGRQGHAEWRKRG
ncbi:hypothetical protein M2401_004992 [Pseudomonas sp. JUb42]|uniref:DUF1652 domain-containing protein n=1 Tax=Pseudomonas sp. JUb42 TaxID=2940611 RepID=UPI00216872C9|nr:DUF1652 domain-containing protein [Pseudomonas sp. JUb42]MCS3471230.1 hypothetical protein [Pseudomonas sp. JUb42]